jgi:hypothetical protein
VGIILVVLGAMHFLILASCASYGKTHEPRRPYRREHPLDVSDLIEPENA